MQELLEKVTKRVAEVLMINNPMLPQTNWQIPTTFPTIHNARRISIDIETYDPNLKTRGPGWVFNDGYIIGVAVAVDDAQPWYFPVQHKEGPNLSKQVVYRWLNRQLGGKSIKIMFNAMYDMGWLNHEGVTINGAIRDPMAAAALLDENRRFYNLDSLGKDWLGVTKSEEALRRAALAFGIGDPKANLWQLPSAYVGPYAEQDARLNLLLDDYTLPLIHKENLENLYSLECRQFRALLAMRKRGVRVDEDKAHKIGKQLESTEAKFMARIQTLCGEEMHVDVWSGLSLAKLYDRLKLPYKRTDKDNPSFTAPWLEKQTDEISQCIVGIRRANRARSTFSSGLITDHAYNGRIHCEFHPLKNDEYGTVSGRYSSARPNLQQIPARDPEIGPLVRSMFIPEEGMKWYKHDYSQQEPRLTVHYARLNNEPGSDAAVRYYQSSKNPDYHQMIADMAGIARKPAKTINLGLAYGMGKAKLAAELGMAPDAVEGFLQKYHSKVPFVKALSNDCMNLAANRGFIRTILNRRCRFNKWEACDWDLAKKLGAQPDREQLLVQIQKELHEAREAKQAIPRSGVRRAFTYRAMNRLIQGSAADMMKKALAEVFEAGFVPHIQVHDELDSSLECDKDAKKIQDIMETCVELVVPVRVDVATGKNWGELKDLL